MCVCSLFLCLWLLYLFFYSLADLERTRDELLIQLYHSDDSYTDKNTVSTCSNTALVSVVQISLGFLADTSSLL